jgi:hypothetical protein
VPDGDGRGDGDEDRPGELAGRGERDGRPEPVLLRPGPGLVPCPGPGERAGGPDGAGAGATTPKLEPGPGLGARPGGRTAIAAAVRTVASPAVTAMIVGGSSRYGCTRNDRAQLRAIVATRSSTVAAATPAAGRRGP